MSDIVTAPPRPKGLLKWFFLYDGSPEGLRAVAQVIRGVEFRPQEGRKWAPQSPFV